MASRRSRENVRSDAGKCGKSDFREKLLSPDVKSRDSDLARASEIKRDKTVPQTDTGGQLE